METIIAEFHVSHDEATAAAAGKSNKRKNSKNLRAMETRKKMMFELEKGNTALISYQQAIGGSISRSEKFTRGDLDEDSEPLICPRSNVVIVVPDLEEIRVPPAPVQHIPALPVLAPAPVTGPSASQPQSPDSFRHVRNVGQKRKSNASYSVAGANLRTKRRRIQPNQIPGPAELRCEDLTSQAEILTQFPGELRKKDCLDYFGLSSCSKLSLEQGRFVRERRLRELDMRLSENETPADGSCMFHALYDQIQLNRDLADYVECQWELRWKLVSEGYEKFLITDKLSWPDFGEKKNWRRNMLNPNEWGDEIVLNLASNLWSVDIVVVPAFKESSHDQGPGLTVIRPLTAIKHKPLFLFAYSESDFYSPHYESVWPNNNESDLSRYLLRLSTYDPPALPPAVSPCILPDENTEEIPIMLESPEFSVPVGIGSSSLTELTEEDFSSIQYVIADSHSG